METRASYILIGIFTLAIFIGGAVAVIWMAGVQFDEEVAQYDAYFEGSVTGLSPGNQVRYRGVPFGIVTGMRIDPKNVERVKVTIEVPKEPPIKTDAVASLEYQGITGVAYVQISGGTQEATVLKTQKGENNPVIKTAPSQLDIVMEKAPELVTRFIALVDRANQLFNPANQKRFSGILENVEGFTGALSDSSTDIRTMMKNGASSLGEVQAAAAEAKAALSKIRGSTDRMTSDAELAMRDARKLVADLRIQANNLGKDIETTLDDVRGSVNRVSMGVETSASEVTEGVLKVSNEATLTLSEIKLLASELRSSALEFTGGIGKALETIQREMDGIGGETQSAIKTLNVSAGHVGDAAEQLAVLIKENREPVEDFTGSGLYELTQLLSETRVLVGALSRISSQIEQNPAQFLFGETQRGIEVK